MTERGSYVGKEVTIGDKTGEATPIAIKFSDGTTWSKI